MATPKFGYYIEGVRIPSVTTVLSKFKDSQDLIAWAWRCGRDGKDYNEERDRAAKVGTAAHSHIEFALAGQPIPDNLMADVHADDIQQARNSIAAWDEWRKSVPSLTIEATEVNLVSKTHRFGGTFDAVGLIEGERYVLDWKTSAKVYKDHLIQAAAYCILWNENNQSIPVSRFVVVRLDKKTGKFHLREEHFIEKYCDAFLALRKAYDLIQAL